jgi:hypothetical protein
VRVRVEAVAVLERHDGRIVGSMVVAFAMRVRVSVLVVPVVVLV